MEKETNIIIRISPKDKVIVKALAKKCGLPLSEYARKLLLNGKIILVDPEQKKVLNGLANNLNQLTRYYNSTRIKHSSTEAILLKLINEIRDAYRKC